MRAGDRFNALLRPPDAEGIDIIGSVGDQAEQRSSCLGLDQKSIPKRCRGADRGLSADAGDGLADPSRSGLGAEAAPAAFEDQIRLFILGMPAHTVSQRGRQIRVSLPVRPDASVAPVGHRVFLPVLQWPKYMPLRSAVTSVLNGYMRSLLARGGAGIASWVAPSRSRLFSVLTRRNALARPVADTRSRITPHGLSA